MVLNCGTYSNCLNGSCVDVSKSIDWRNYGVVTPVKNQ